MIKININTLTTSREAIPANLRGLSNLTLNNLQTELNPVPDDLIDIEYWAEDAQPTVFDSETEKLGNEILTPDVPSKTVIVTHEVVALTVQEMADNLAYNLSQLQSDLTQAIQAHLNQEAQSRNYDDINSIGKYIGYVNQFQVECELLGAWTADVWAYAIAELGKVEAGTREAPTVEEFLLELPAI